MEYNLKNRPKLCHFDHPKSQPEITLKAMNEWFEGFEEQERDSFDHVEMEVIEYEKEIVHYREENKKPLLASLRRLSYLQGYLDAKKEILGDEE